jgi:hypothetical protein
MRKITAMMLATLLAGCGAFDSFKEGFTHTQEVAADLEKSVGAKPFVGFNWHNGSLRNVNVTFKGIPDGKSITEIAALARTSIASHFKQEPTEIVIGFALSGSMP